ncbi:ABC-2 type transporter-domain-containing protein, partial [Lipomyces starkeyi]
LDVLASRTSLRVDGDVRLTGVPRTQQLNRYRYVQQEDALIGSLTVRETLLFAAMLGQTSSHQDAIAWRVEDVIVRLGLSRQRDTRIGTPLQKGLSGGQKRRVSVGEKLVATCEGEERIVLFLDEVTSGLDAVAAYEVVSRVKEFAVQSGIIVVASIHQPSTATFMLFDSVLLLSAGKQIYFGTTAGVTEYFGRCGLVIPNNYNPAEFLLEVSNTDFVEMKDDVEIQERKITVDRLYEAWNASGEARELDRVLSDSSLNDTDDLDSTGRSQFRQSLSSIVLTYRQSYILVHRSFIKARRDILVYGVRVVMYLCLALLMGTVWLRLSATQYSIQAFINALFFGAAFMSFMAVAYIPSFLEDHATFTKERHEEMYGPLAFLIANILVGAPFLLMIALLFSVVMYWMTGYLSTATAFFRFVTWLFLDLIAAESLVVLISSIVPIFVAALALTAFTNALWMAVAGYLVAPGILNKFWYYTFYWIDYQRYVFEGMLFNEVESREYLCPMINGSCSSCMYTAHENADGNCVIDGKDVLIVGGYGGNHTGMWVGLEVALAVAMRLLTYLWYVNTHRRKPSRKG